MGLNYMAIGEVSKLCGVSPATVRRWIKQGRLPAVRLPSGHHRIRKDSYSAFASRHGLPINEEVKSE